VNTAFTDLFTGPAPTFAERPTDIELERATAFVFGADWNAALTPRFAITPGVRVYLVHRNNNPSWDIGRLAVQPSVSVRYSF
jgi:hypothetical protein